MIGPYLCASKCTDSLPAAWINDDFCDCPEDGSDEPRTSACVRGLFYCANRGFRPQYVRASVVGDGVCDCCDGTDEWSDHQSQQVCRVTCVEDAIAARAKAALHLKAV